MAKRLPPAPISANIGDFIWKAWFDQIGSSFNSIGGYLIRSPTDPIAADIPVDGWALYKNTSTGVISIWVNDNGTITRLYAFALAAP